MAFTWAGGNILAFCEIDSYCQKVLRKHWPDVPIFTDVREINRGVIRNAGIFETVDVVYGGFPCQPFSVAGDKKGENDTRYLWPEFSRVVGEFRPRWVVGENVPGILTIAADTVCADLERQGYEVGIWDYEAASVGAKHRRERIFFVAHAGRALRQRISEAGNIQETHGERITAPTERPDSTHVHGRGNIEERLIESEFCRGINVFSAELDSISPIATGIPNRTNRLKTLGNAVVPQQIYPIFKAIIEIEHDKI